MPRPCECAFVSIRRPTARAIEPHTIDGFATGTESQSPDAAARDSRDSESDGASGSGFSSDFKRASTLRSLLPGTVGNKGGRSVFTGQIHPKAGFYWIHHPQVCSLRSPAYYRTVHLCGHDRTMALSWANKACPVVKAILANLIQARIVLLSSKELLTRSSGSIAKRSGS